MTQTQYQMLLDNLHITYTPDPSTVSRITNECDAGVAYIRRYGDPGAECEPGTESGALLCEYVLRAEAGALETFQQDFLADLIQLKALYDVNGFAEAKGYEEAGQET